MKTQKAKLSELKCVMLHDKCNHAIMGGEDRRMSDDRGQEYAEYFTMLHTDVGCL